MPRSTAATLLVALAICTAAIGVSAQTHELHGSGTTNPSKFFWKVMDLMEERSRPSVTMTYRAVGASRTRAREPVACETRRVTFPRESEKNLLLSPATEPRPPPLPIPLVSGSGTGQSDFIGSGTADGNYNHFGSGDIPFDADDFADANDVHTQFIQVPFVIGGIAFFHSVPASYGEIDLDACLLAKIFKRDITRWNDPEIVALNPALASLDQPITVARRVEGSSSTSLITKYLHAGCPEVWQPEATMVGKVPCSADKTTNCVTWASDTVEAQGSGGISGYLAANPYSISYIDNGHGLSSGLGEIALKNLDGNFVKPSTEGAVAGAALGSTGPTGATRSASAYSNTWEDVSLMNLAGENTWPICTFSYMYIRKDMSGWTGDDEKSAWLVKAFAQFVLSEEAQDMLPEFGFVGLPAEILEQARIAVDGIVLPGIVLPATEVWQFEKDTNDKLDMLTGLTDADEPIVGQNPFVFSSKRSAYADYERTKLVATVAALQAKVDALQTEHVSLHPSAWYDDPTTQIEGAAAVGALGFIFGFIALVLGAVAVSRVKGLAKNAGGGYQI